MKIKTENDYLGLLIKNMDDNFYVDYSKIIPYIKDYDILAFNHYLLDKHWIRITHNEGLYLSQIGINNYISWKDRVISWLISSLKFFVSYTLGIFSGVAVAYFVKFLAL